MDHTSIHIHNLPAELMTMIFQMLPPEDRKSIMLVCKAWMKVGGYPRLWSWSVITINSKLDFHKLKAQRVQLIQKIKVKRCEHLLNTGDCPKWKTCLAELFTIIHKIPTISKINGFSELCKWSLATVEPNLLADVFSRLEAGELSNRLTEEQIDHILAAVVGKTNLRRLDVFHSDMSRISPSFFAKALSNVNEVAVGPELNEPGDQSCGKIDEQMLALFVAIIEKESPMRSLDLYVQGAILKLNANIVGEALNRIESVHIEDTKLSTEQLTSLARNILKDESRVKNMMLFDLWFEEMGLDIEADLVEKVRKKIGYFL